MTLTEFLLARIAEDEAAARDRQDWVAEQMGRVSDAQRHPGTVGVSLSSWDFGPGDAARVLADLAAKRRIVNACAQVVDHDADCLGAMAAKDACRYTLKQLALPYASHPDYPGEDPNP